MYIYVFAIDNGLLYFLHQNTRHTMGIIHGLILSKVLTLFTIVCIYYFKLQYTPLNMVTIFPVKYDLKHFSKVDRKYSQKTHFSMVTHEPGVHHILDYTSLFPLKYFTIGKRCILDDLRSVLLECFWSYFSFELLIFVPVPRSIVPKKYVSLIICHEL